MPAIDVCQPQIIRALEKDGWRVYLRNAHFYNDGESIYIDLGIEKSHPPNENQHLFIEIKCFPEKRTLSELYLALGQVGY
ncbi:MAG TPA: element excision factor XisH family protein, partial [Aggregatilineales bacterium]|nr:element excision factor XisH family protein [Aggregatilineales bacterium]